MLSTHWGRVTNICISKLTIIGSDNGLSPNRSQAIIWTKAGILLIGPLGTNFSDILIKIHIFSFKKMHLIMLSVKCRPFCFCLNVLGEASHFSYSQVQYAHIFLLLLSWLDLCPANSQGRHDDVIQWKHFSHHWPFVPVTWSFDVFFDLCMNEGLSKQRWCWWFEMPSHLLWHLNKVYE